MYVYMVKISVSKCFFLYNILVIKLESIRWPGCCGSCWVCGILRTPTQGGTNTTNYIQRAKPAKVQPHTARSDW